MTVEELKFVLDSILPRDVFRTEFDVDYEGVVDVVSVNNDYFVAEVKIVGDSLLVFVDPMFRSGVCRELLAGKLGNGAVLHLDLFAPDVFDVFVSLLVLCRFR